LALLTAVAARLEIMRLRSALFPKRTSAQRLDETPKFDSRLSSGTVPVIAIPLAFRDAVAISSWHGRSCCSNCRS
jgi:hypothetical protein